MLSAAGAALLRRLLDRAADDRHRFLLSSWTSVDWQSMTFAGERHRAAFRLTGSDAMGVARRWLDGIEQAEFDLGPTRFLAEITVSDGPVDHGHDGVTLSLEALTLSD